MMKANIKELWVQALRSGKYQQGRAWLHNADENEYCCLGVLCEVAKENGVEMSVRTETKGFDTVTLYDTHSQFLPPSVCEWAGLHAEESPTVQAQNPYTGEENQYTLVDLNDEWQWSFNKIADIIEDQF